MPINRDCGYLWVALPLPLTYFVCPMHDCLFVLIRKSNSFYFLKPIYFVLFCLVVVWQPSLYAQVRSNTSAVSSLKSNTKTLKIQVVDETDNSPLPMATCVIKSLGAFSLVDDNGVAKMDIPTNEKLIVEVSYLGFETAILPVTIDKSITLKVKMKPTSLALKEVTVVAKSSSAGASTSSHIGRQAIDHLQATSLGDLLQLVPGNLMNNTNLTTKSSVQLRTLSADQTNGFGTSLIIDGVPVSTNANLGMKGAYTGTTDLSVDLRQIGVDNIESVEVIRGIPSAEYGDLISGAVIVKTKQGYTPWQAKGKINPTTRNFSLGKGFKLKQNNGVINVDFDYAQAWSDPRKKTESFDRYTAKITYTRDYFKTLRTTTSFSYSGLLDWSGDDSDVVSEGLEVKERNNSYRLSHSGVLSLNKRFSRSINYSIGFSYTDMSYRKTTIVTNSSGYLPILTARETGYFSVPYESSSYKASGGTKSSPKNLYAKISNSFYLKSNDLHQLFNMGLEYKREANSGAGYYNDNDRYPLTPNNNGRPRSYNDIPVLNQLSMYVEDKLSLNIGSRLLKLNLGARVSTQQLFNDEKTISVSPRINAAYELNSWLNVRLGYGINSKAPGTIHLYPDKKYDDRVAASYLPVGLPEQQLVMYHTQVYDTKRTKGLQNANNTKWELGLDATISDTKKISVIGYYDRTKNGFGNVTEYYTYTSNFYDQNKGLVISAGKPTVVDWNNPARVDTVFASTGKVGNKEVSINKGLEMEVDLGRFNAINTAFYLTGAYMETESYSNAISSSSPSGLPSQYALYDTTPFKVVYPSGVSKNIYKRFSTNLRLVCNLPALRMVASLATQTIWYSYSYYKNQKYDPIGWIDTDLSYHEITTDMLNDENYMIKGVSLAKQRRNPKDNPGVKQPISWLLNARLTKELGANAGLSFYANNAFYYEPFQRSGSSGTLTQSNEGFFNYGVEFFFKF